MVLGAFLVLMFGLVSVSAGSPHPIEKTIIDGVIYQDSITNPIGGADVQVTCHHNGNDYSQSTTSDEDGHYAIEFKPNKCDYGDDVTVYAQKESLVGVDEGNVDILLSSSCKLKLNIGIVNVPLVPEFGLIGGMIAVLGSLGIFFVVRKK